jgi:hypothetical protein
MLPVERSVHGEAWPKEGGSNSSVKKDMPAFPGLSLPLLRAKIL